MKNINVKIMDWKDIYFCLFFADRKEWEEDFFKPIEKILESNSDFPQLEAENFVSDMVSSGEILGFEVVPSDMLRLLGMDDEGIYFIES